MWPKPVQQTLMVFLIFGESAMSLAQDTALPSRFAVMDDVAAWQRMPQARPVLPIWARMLVQPLPKATAAFLQLDYLHRADNPLGPVLAGKLRWTAADAIGCDYARRYAEADLRRAGVTDEQLERMRGEGTALPVAERSVLAFARQLTLAGHEITDSQMAALVEQLGPEQVVGIVHTVAFANFENRVFLALGVDVEPDGPLPPVELELDSQQQADVGVPPRRSTEELQAAAPSTGVAARVDWGQKDFAALELALDRQKQRGPRIPIPAVERLAHLPAPERERTAKVVWSRVSVGYQPQLTAGWFRLMQTFRDEAALDRVFANSMFWVVTRSNECFY